MSQRVWVRMGAFSGFVYVILLIVGFALGVASAPTPPSVFGTPEQVGTQIAQVAPTGVLTGVLSELGFYYGACCLYCPRSYEEKTSTTK